MYSIERGEGQVERGILGWTQLNNAKQLLLQVLKRKFLFWFLGLFHQLSFAKYHFVGGGGTEEFIIVASPPVLLSLFWFLHQNVNHVAMKIVLADCFVFCAHILPFLSMAIGNVNEESQFVMVVVAVFYLLLGKFFFFFFFFFFCLWLLSLPIKKDTCLHDFCKAIFPLKPNKITLTPFKECSIASKMHYIGRFMPNIMAERRDFPQTYVWGW